MDIYIVDEKKVCHIISENIDRNTLYKILPPVGRYYSSQNMSGTCFNLSGCSAILNEPEIAAYLTRRIHLEHGQLSIRMPYNSTPNNMFAGTPGLTNDGVVYTFLKDYKYSAKNASQTVRSNPLIQALETMYGAHRKFTIADEYIKYLKNNKLNYQAEFNYLKQHMNETIIIKTSNGGFRRYTLDEFNRDQMYLYNIGKIKTKPKQFITADDYYKESGTVNEIFNFYLKGRCAIQKFDIPSNLTNTDTDMNSIRKMLETKSAKSFSTLLGGIDTMVLNQNRNLYRRHAYSIINYDKNTDIVTYVNPWNSSLTYHIKLTELLPYISSIDIARYA